MEQEPLLHSVLLLLARLLLLSVLGSYIADRAVFFFMMPKILASQDSGRDTQNDGLRVIVCGFPRSGTMSLKMALDYLGFPCYHGSQLFTPGHAALWLQSKKGKLKGMKGMLKGYSSIVGLPSIAFIEELMEAYPEAKVILHQRDPEEWYRSCSRTLYAVHRRLLSRMFKLGMWRVAEEAFFQDLFNGRFGDKEFSLSVYKSKFEKLKKIVPRQKLLGEYQSKDGWEPLCNFLGVPIPSSPFPRLHATHSFLHNAYGIERTLFLVLCIHFAFIACTIAFLLKCEAFRGLICFPNLQKKAF